MYADFFGFRELPFNNTPDPRFFFSTPDHEEALASLIYAVKERKGFVLLTGEVGAGKTLVTRMMLRHFSSQIMFANINHAVQNADDLMESICTEFELPIDPDVGGTQLVRVLHDYLLTQFAQNLPVVLVLDEAQNLSIEGFERLRMIGNLESDDAKLLQIAIVGQPELQRMFLSPKLRQLRQRLFRSFHLPSLNRGATEAYIRHRLKVVSDHADDIFRPDALEAVYVASRGLPRLINTVCDNALLSAYSADRRMIDARFVQSVVAQMTLVGEVPDPSLSHDPTQLPESPSPYPRGVAPSSGPFQTTAGSTQHDLITDRVAALEARLGHASPIMPPHVPYTPTPQVGDPIDSIRAEFAVLRRDIDWQVSDMRRRVQAVETYLQANQRDGTNAIRLPGELESSIAKAQSCTKRAEATTAELKRREEEVRDVSRKASGVVGDLRKLLRGLSDETTKANEAAQNAQITHERLANQSRRSRELAGDLTRCAFEAAARLPIRSSSTAKLKERGVSSEVADLAASTNPSASAPDSRVRRKLAGVQESLSELRDLTRDSAVGYRTAVDHDAQPTDRLAQQVERLLGMISSPNGKDERSDAAQTPVVEHAASQ